MGNLKHAARRVGCRMGLSRWGTGNTHSDGRVDRECDECGTQVMKRARRFRPNTAKATRDGRHKAQGDTTYY